MEDVLLPLEESYKEADAPENAFEPKYQNGVLAVCCTESIASSDDELEP